MPSEEAEANRAEKIRPAAAKRFHPPPRSTKNSLDAFPHALGNVPPRQVNEMKFMINSFSYLMYPRIYYYLMCPRTAGCKVQDIFKVMSMQNRSQIWNFQCIHRCKIWKKKPFYLYSQSYELGCVRPEQSISWRRQKRTGASCNIVMKCSLSRALILKRTAISCTRMPTCRYLNNTFTETDISGWNWNSGNRIIRQKNSISSLAPSCLVSTRPPTMGESSDNFLDCDQSINLAQWTTNEAVIGAIMAENRSLLALHNHSSMPERDSWSEGQRWEAESAPFHLSLLPYNDSAYKRSNWPGNVLNYRHSQHFHKAISVDLQLAGKRADRCANNLPIKLRASSLNPFARTCLNQYRSRLYFGEYFPF